VSEINSPAVGITEEMIVAGADVIDPTHAFASTKRTVREVLEAALAGRTVRDRRSYIADETSLRGRWGVARCAYAAAHDIEPHEVDTTDGSYADLSMVITEDYWEMLEVLSKAAGLPDDSDFADILEWISARASGSSESGDPKP
jgi:hypothetical protein